MKVERDERGETRDCWGEIGGEGMKEREEKNRYNLGRLVLFVP